MTNISLGKPDTLSQPVDITNRTENSEKSKKFTMLFNKISGILNSKDLQYREDPIFVLSTIDLLTQIKIKAVRAELTIYPDKAEKLEDELLDIIVYSMLTLDKIYTERKEIPELKRNTA
ncbi:MAG: hypothetical protein WC877_00960 [Dehalococcoidales bacterium]|jgi:hypothetical protein